MLHGLSGLGGGLKSHSGAIVSDQTSKQIGLIVKVTMSKIINL